jgi:hypothetical protein
MHASYLKVLDPDHWPLSPESWNDQTRGERVGGKTRREGVLRAADSPLSKTRSARRFQMAGSTSLHLPIDRTDAPATSWVAYGRHDSRLLRACF